MFGDFTASSGLSFCNSWAWQGVSITVVSLCLVLALFGSFLVLMNRLCVVLGVSLCAGGLWALLGVSMQVVSLVLIIMSSGLQLWVA